MGKNFDKAVQDSPLVQAAIDYVKFTDAGKAAIAADKAEAEEREFDKLFGANGKKRSSFHERYDGLTESESLNQAMGLPRDHRTRDELTEDELLDLAMGTTSER